MRDTTSQEITRLWHIIRTHNVQKKNTKSLFDLNKIYADIKVNTVTRINLKLYSLAINLGYTDYSKFIEDFGTTGGLFGTIYELNELQEQYVQLGKIMFISRRKKKLDKVNDEVEVWHWQTVQAMRNKLQAEISNLKQELVDWNNRELTVETEDSTEVEVAAAA